MNCDLLTPGPAAIIITFDSMDQGRFGWTMLIAMEMSEALLIALIRHGAHTTAFMTKTLQLSAVSKNEMPRRRHSLI